ncbi:MAG: Smr/MutS family protein [Acidobacteria bacterium]|nr:Smr/MutS family protein [Acidobacteriota bacterium]
MIDDKTSEALELGALIELIAGYAQTPAGRKLALGLQPSADRTTVESALAITTEAVDYLRTGARFGIGGIEDPEPALAQLPVEGTALDPHQILILERLISVGLELRDLFRQHDLRERYPNLSRLAERIPDLRRLLSGIRGKILPGGEISDDASPELKAIRREMLDSRTRIHRHLESIMRTESRAVQEELITFRNGRFVIPIRTDSRNLVPGVVHGLSGSGQTTFIEPLAVIEQNNELVRLREQEEFEIARILLSITNSLRANLDAVKAVASAIAEFDIAQAKGRFSIEFKCARPTLSTGSDVFLADARHVLLELALRRSKADVVPISLELDDTHHVLVISGPNAGGKTVVLKTVGLAAVMTQMGLHVAAREARLPVFGQICADIGDQQSIAANLSTFTAHMRNVSEMARAVTPPALVLIDEVGTGTDPDEGSALAVAIVDHFRRTGAITIVTTHYNGLKIWASQAENVRNASVEFDERTLRPTYRLILGIAGASAGLEIARRMDVPASILDSARSLIDQDQLQAGEYLRRLKAAADEQQSLIVALAEEREAAAEKYRSLEEVFAKREAARSAEFDAALSRALEEFKTESDRLIRSLKDRVEAERLRRAAANRAAELRRVSDRLRAQAHKSGTLRQVASPGEPLVTGRAEEMREGDRVRVLSISREGVIETVHGNGFTVLVGPLRYRAEREDVVPVAPARPEAKGSGIQIAAAGADVDSDVPTEINVIGMRSDDARDRVDKFLDAAFLANKESVRIIHGHGKGILRRAIADLLAEHPQVERFALPPPEQGRGGATIAELKK